MLVATHNWLRALTCKCRLARLLTGSYRTREQARIDVFYYIERFYNPFRKHSKLNYLSPVQFEEQQRLTG